jgi:hypothetical protein
MRAYARCSALALAVACGTSACGGGGSSGTPAPASSSAPLQATVVSASRGLLTVVLTALQTARYYEEYLRPGIGPVFGALPPNANPVCNAATHTASTSFSNQTGTSTLVTTAFYPANDATCSMSPFRILVMQYAAAGSAQAGYGYQLTYSSANDPVFGGAGVLVGADEIAVTIYKNGDGTANLVSNIVAGGASFSNPPAQPAPGPFPATFPTGLPAPESFTPFGLFFANAETGTTSTTGSANLGGSFPAPASFGPGYLGRLGSVDHFAVTATPQAGGAGSLSLVDRSPQFVVDVTNGGIVPTVTPAYPFPSGATTLGLGPLSPFGYRSSAANLPQPITTTATYDASGSPLTCSLGVTDPLDGVQVQAACGAGGANTTLTVTDLLRKASAISPASIVLDAYGYSTGSFTFLFDGSVDSVGGFNLQ